MLLTHILNFFQIIVVVLQSREVFLRLIESEPKSIQIMVVSTLIEKNPFSYKEQRDCIRVWSAQAGYAATDGHLLRSRVPLAS